MKIKQRLFNRLLEPSINKLLYISWNNYIFYSLVRNGFVEDFSYDDFNLEFQFDKDKLDSLVSRYNLDNFETYCNLLNVGLKEIQK